MRKTLLLVAAGTVMAVGLARRGDDAPAKLMENRLWIDRLPDGPRDTVQLFVALRDEALGIFDASSAWRGSYELFHYELHGEQLRIVYPQTGAGETVRTTAVRCTAPPPMELCLELDGASHGAKRYYSRDDWSIDGRDVDAAKKRFAALRATLVHP